MQQDPLLGAHNTDLGIIRGQQPLPNDAQEVETRAWSSESGIFRGDVVRGVVRFSLLRDRLPKQNQSRDPRHRYRRAKWNTLQFCDCKPRRSTTVTVVCEGHETRQYQIHVFPRPLLRAFLAGLPLARGYRCLKVLWPIRRGQQKNAVRQASDALHEGR